MQTPESRACRNWKTCPAGRWFQGEAYWARRSWAILRTHMADDKLYSAQYIGSGTFIISKPKRKASKRRQSKLKGTVRGARK
jgi:hypothetical protein